ncbi:recombinase family protein [Streptomyces pseudoechinosporeus]
MPRAEDKDGDSETVDVAAYVRVSTAEQRRRYGIPAQEQAIHAFVEQRPTWRLAGCRQDIGESGSTHSRPGFDVLLGDITAGRVNLVLVHRLDRLGRTEAAIWRCIWQVEDAGARVECCTEPLGEPGVEQWLTVDRLAQDVEADYRRIVARTQAGRQMKAVDGGWPGGPAPYGYRLSGKGSFGSMLEVDPDEASVVRLIADLVIDGGYNLKKLTEELNDRGILTRSGKRWSPANLSRRLKSATFLEEAVFRRPDRQWGGHCTRLGEDGRPLYGDSVVILLPPILTADRIKSFQDTLAGLSRTRQNPNAEYPLTGRIHGPCGLPYVGFSRGKDGLRTYRCSGMQGAVSCGCVFLPAEFVEDQVARRVNALLASMSPKDRPALPASSEASTMLIGHIERVRSLDRLMARCREDLEDLRNRATRDHVVAAAVRQRDSDLEAFGRIVAQARDWLHELEELENRDARLRAVLASATPDIRALSPREQRRMVELTDVRVEITDPAFRYREGTRCSTMQWHQRTGTPVPPDPTDGQWERIEQLLRSRYSGHHFRSPLDLRTAFTGMLHRLRTGILWSDLPERFGEWVKVRTRQRAWLESGVWVDIMRLLNEKGEGTPVFERGAPPLAIRTGLDAERVC